MDTVGYTRVNIHIQGPECPIFTSFVGLLRCSIALRVKPLNSEAILHGLSKHVVNAGTAQNRHTADAVYEN